MFPPCCIACWIVLLYTSQHYYYYYYYFSKTPILQETLRMQDGQGNRGLAENCNISSLSLWVQSMRGTAQLKHTKQSMTKNKDNHIHRSVTTYTIIAKAQHSSGPGILVALQWSSNCSLPHRKNLFRRITRPSKFSRSWYDWPMDLLPTPWWRHRRHTPQKPALSLIQRWSLQA